MVKAKILLSSVVAVAATMLISSGAVAADADVVAAFVAQCEKDKNLDDAKRKQILDLIERDRGEDAHSTSTITGALRVMYPEFQKALIALGDEDFDVAGKQLAELAKSENRFLADDAKYFLARNFMNSERYEEALPLLKGITEASGKALTLHKGEALFMRAVCETGLLDRKSAIASYKRFLKENPHAAERLQVGAEHQIAELELITDGSLLDVQARMEASRRLLGLEKSGDPTQQQQEKIVSLLTALIKEAEQQEKECCPDCGKKDCKKSGGT